MDKLGEILTELTKTIREKRKTRTYSSDQPEEDLSKYDCIICKDKRLIFKKINCGVPKRGLGPDPDYPEGHEIPADDWIREINPENAIRWRDEAAKCSCVERIKKEKEMERILATSNLSPRFQKRRFDTIKWLDPREFHSKDRPEVEKLMAGQKRAYDLVLSYCIRFEEHKELGQGFGLFGDVGTAKTHLLAAAVNYLLERKIQAVHVNTAELFDEIRSTYELDEQGKPLKEIRASEIIHLIKSCEYLSLDDLGTEKPTEWVKEKFYEILNHRYENEMPTAFSTNNTLEELQEHLGKSYRRLIEPCAGRMTVIEGASFDQLLSRKK